MTRAHSCAAVKGQTGEAVVSGDFEAKVTELPAVHSDGELPPLNENPGSSPETSPLSPDHYTTADIRTLVHRLYALATQI
jgi:hypothetical protein